MMIYCASRFKPKKKRKSKGVVARKLRRTDIIAGVNKLPDLSIKRNSTAHIPSLGTNACYTQKRESLMYTGTLVKGIAVTHKSNLIPITSKEQAEEVARMRRG